jgi:hypothetical protein
MTRTIVAILGSLLFGTLFLTAGPTYTTRTYTGVITDTMCEADHAKMQITPESKCVQECVRNGAKYALLSGQNVYLLSDQKRPAKFAGQKVRIDGILNSKKKMLTVMSIYFAK